MPTNLPPEVANNPEAMAQLQQLNNRVNGTIANGNTMNHVAEGIAGAGLGAEALGLLGGGGAAGAAQGATDSGGVLGALESAGGKLTGLAGPILGGLKSLGGFVKDHSGDLLAAANIAEAAARQKKADAFANQAMGLASDAYNQKAPLRLAGVNGMLNPGALTPDLSALRGLAGQGSGNPFAHSLPMAGPQAVGNHGLRLMAG